MMERHPTDFVELLFGLAFLGAGGGFVIHQTTSHAFDPAWIAAIALVAVGCAFLAATLFRRPRVLPTESVPGVAADAGVVPDAEASAPDDASEPM